MTDTHESLKRAEHLERTGRELCDECGHSFETQLMTDFADERVCLGCLKLIKRTCKRCLKDFAEREGIDARMGFFCGYCLDEIAKQGQDAVRQQVFGNLAEPCDADKDWALDHEFESEKAERRYAREQHEHLRG